MADAVGDVISAHDHDVTDDGYLDCKPTGTVQWVIHNIYCDGDTEIYWDNGSNEILVQTITGGGWITGIFAHCTADHYLAIKNVEGGASGLGYDGVISRL